MKFRNLLPFLNKFRRSNGDIHVPESLEIATNVSIVARERGKKVAERSSHNIVVNNGRTWLRDLVASISYPADYWTTMATDPSAASNVLPASDFRPRFIGFGVGGTLQGVTEPGPGAFTEVTTVRGLENPVTIEAGKVLHQINPQIEGDANYYPDAFSIRFRSVITEQQISFVGSVSNSEHVFNTSVPLSEIGLFSSQAVDLPADTTDYDEPEDIVQPPIVANVVKGFLAYNTFSTIVKTPLIQLEVVWEWRF